MRTKILIFISALCLSGSAIAADQNTDEQKEAMKARAQQLSQACPYPAKPSIPDGRNSTEEQMLDAQAKMKAFINDGNSFIDCLDQQQQGWGEDAKDTDKMTVVILHNQMVDDMQSVADLFNSAVRAFKGKK